MCGNEQKRVGHTQDHHGRQAGKQAPVKPSVGQRRHQRDRGKLHDNNDCGKRLHFRSRLDERVVSNETEQRQECSKPVQRTVSLVRAACDGALAPDQGRSDQSTAR